VGTLRRVDTFIQEVPLDGVKALVDEMLASFKFTGK